MALIVLLGRHGSGKSTIGSYLESYGYKHASVGMIRRLAQSRQFPVDIPVPLIISMKKEKPGQALNPQTSSLLLKFVSGLGNCVIDGFPTTIDQLHLLPKNSVFIYVGISKSVRLERLEYRAATSKRQWIPGLRSEREEALVPLLKQLRAQRKLFYVSNTEDKELGISEIAKKIIKISQT